MGRIGFGELVVILIIALLVFGPSKLPEMGKAVGNAMREFRDAAKGITDDSPSEASNKE